MLGQEILLINSNLRIGLFGATTIVKIVIKKGMYIVDTE